MRVIANVDAHLVIMGREGDATRQLHSSPATLRIEDNVTEVGYTPEIHHCMANADGFVFSAFMVGLGTAMLEAWPWGSR